MSNKPSEIIPIPKEVRLPPADRAWPGRIEVQCEASGSESLRGAFESELKGLGDGALFITLAASDGPSDRYRLEFAAQALRVRAGGTAGFRYALATLKQIASTGLPPTGSVEDWPTLKWRGFHLNLEHYRRMGLDESLRFIQTAASLKINVLLVEYGSRFPIESHPQLRDPTAFSVADIERLKDAANAAGIEIIPLQQSIAHLEYALGKPHLAHLRERPERPNLLCPAHPESMALFKALAQDVIARHPDAKHFHLGGDEARKIGACERCSPIARRDGRGALYGRYIGECARWLLEKGLRPIVWDDTLCAYPDAFKHLPKEVIIDYWDYIAVADPTPVLIPRMAHIDGAPRVCHDWHWSLTKKRGKLSDVQRRVMKDYSEAARLKGSLGKAYMSEFGRYLGDGFPKWIRAMPYLEYYLDRGHDVITSPTGMGNGDTTDGVPNFARFDDNICTHARRCAERKRALGMICTAWYNMPAEMLYQPLIRTAMCAWSTGVRE